MKLADKILKKYSVEEIEHAFSANGTDKERKLVLGFLMRSTTGPDQFRRLCFSQLGLSKETKDGINQMMGSNEWRRCIDVRDNIDEQGPNMLINNLTYQRLLDLAVIAYEHTLGALTVYRAITAYRDVAQCPDKPLQAIWKCELRGLYGAFFKIDKSGNISLNYTAIANSLLSQLQRAIDFKEDIWLYNEAYQEAVLENNLQEAVLEYYWNAFNRSLEQQKAGEELIETMSEALPHFLSTYNATDMVLFQDIIDKQKELLQPLKAPKIDEHEKAEFKAGLLKRGTNWLK